MPQDDKLNLNSYKTHVETVLGELNPFLNTHPKELFYRIVSGQLKLSDCYLAIMGKFAVDHSDGRHDGQDKAWKFAANQLANACDSLNSKLSDPSLTEEQITEILGRAATDYNPEMPE